MPWAGHFKEAHLAGCSWLSGFVRVNRAEGDIVITSNGGYPLDQNIYQAVKGMTAAESCCREGGVIIMAASCCDGHGGEDFYRSVKEAESPRRPPGGDSENHFGRDQGRTSGSIRSLQEFSNAIP